MLDELTQRFARLDRHPPRRRRRRMSGPVSMVTLRCAEINRLLHHRYGPRLPADDAGHDDALVMLHHLAALAHDARGRMLEWIERHAPWIPPPDVEAVLTKPLRWRADTLGKRLGLTDAVRTVLKIKTIGCIDKTKEQREADRRERNRAEAKRRRRAKAAQPREEYEANSISRSKPWEALRISRATWYRSKRQQAR